MQQEDAEQKRRSIVINAEALLETLVKDGEMSAFEDVQIVAHSPDRIEISFDLQSAPRDKKELLQYAQKDDIKGYWIHTGPGDNSPAELCMSAFFSADETMVLTDLKGLDIEEDGEVMIGLAGILSLPEYCDDECDAWFTGAVYVSYANDGWVHEQIKADTIKTLQSAMEHHLGVPIGFARDLRELGVTGPLSIDRLNDLNRVALAA